MGVSPPHSQGRHLPCFSLSDPRIADLLPQSGQISSRILRTSGTAQYVSFLASPFWLAKSDQHVSTSTQVDALSSLPSALAPNPLEQRTSWTSILREGGRMERVRLAP